MISDWATVPETQRNVANKKGTVVFSDLLTISRKALQ